MHEEDANLDRLYFITAEEKKSRLEARQALLDNSHDPAIKMYLESDKRFKEYKDRVLKQAGVLQQSMDEAEREISNLVTTKFIHQRSSFEDRMTTKNLNLGPPLTAIVLDDRINQCMEILLGGKPEFVEDVGFTAQLEGFAHPTEVIESICRAQQKLLTEIYGASVELAGCVDPQHATKLHSMVVGTRRTLASMAHFTKCVHSQSNCIRVEMEKLQGKLEVIKHHQSKATRLGKELFKENESLRSQLFKAAVSSQSDDAENTSLMLNEKRAEEKLLAESVRPVMIVQVEGTHQLRFQKPLVVAEALLLLLNEVETLLTKRKGQRVNFNAVEECRESFNKISNRRFAAESYAISFTTISDAVLFACELQSQLTRINWPEALLEMDQFRKVLPKSGLSTAAIWCGLRARIGIHSGVPFVSYPFREELSAAELDQHVNSAIPFFGGMLMDKTMMLTQKACGGETLMTNEAANLFNAARFEDHNLATGIQLVERPLPEGLQVGFQQGEKVFSVLPVLLEQRLNSDPDYCYHRVEESVFPSAAFWRQINQAEDLQPHDFDEDDEVAKLRKGALLPHQYEEKIESLQLQIAMMKQEAQVMQENSDRVSVEFIRVQEEFSREKRVSSEFKQKFYEVKSLLLPLQEMVQRHCNRVMGAEDEWEKTAVKLDIVAGKLQQTEATLANTKMLIKPEPETEESMNQTTEPWPDVEKIRLASKRNAEREIELSNRVCEKCLGTDKTFNELKSVLNGCADLFAKGLVGEVTGQQLIQMFTANLQDSMETHHTYESLLDLYGGPKADEDRVTGLLVRLSKMTQVASRLLFAKSVGKKKSQYSDRDFGDELEFLSFHNSKLEEKIIDLNGEMKELSQKHRAEIEKIKEKFDQEGEQKITKMSELELRVRMLSLKLTETADRAQRFFAETCELTEQMEVARHSDTNQKVKVSLLELQQKYKLGQESDEASRILKETNNNLHQRIAGLEARIALREKELALAEENSRLRIELQEQQHDRKDKKREEDLREQMKEEATQFQEKLWQEAEEQRRRDLELQLKEQLKAALSEEERKAILMRDEQRKNMEMQRAKDYLSKDAALRAGVAEMVEAEVKRRLEMMALARAKEAEQQAEKNALEASIDEALAKQAAAQQLAGSPRTPVKQQRPPIPKPKRPPSAADSAISLATDEDGSPLEPTHDQPETPLETSLVAPAVVEQEPPPQPVLNNQFSSPTEHTLARVSSARTFVCATCASKYTLRPMSASVQVGGGSPIPPAPSAPAQPTVDRGSSARPLPKARTSPVQPAIVPPPAKKVTSENEGIQAVVETAGVNTQTALTQKDLELKRPKVRDKQTSTELATIPQPKTVVRPVATTTPAPAPAAPAKQLPGGKKAPEKKLTVAQRALMAVEGTDEVVDLDAIPLGGGLSQIVHDASTFVEFLLVDAETQWSDDEEHEEEEEEGDAVLYSPDGQPIDRTASNEAIHRKASTGLKKSGSSKASSLLGSPKKGKRSKPESPEQLEVPPLVPQRVQETALEPSPSKPSVSCEAVDCQTDLSLDPMSVMVLCIMDPNAPLETVPAVSETPVQVAAPPTEGKNPQEDVPVPQPVEKVVVRKGPSTKEMAVQVRIAPKGVQAEVQTDKTVKKKVVQDDRQVQTEKLKTDLKQTQTAEKKMISVSTFTRPVTPPKPPPPPIHIGIQCQLLLPPVQRGPLVSNGKNLIGQLGETGTLSTEGRAGGPLTPSAVGAKGAEALAGGAKGTTAGGTSPTRSDGSGPASNKQGEMKGRMVGGGGRLAPIRKLGAHGSTAFEEPSAAQFGEDGLAKWDGSDLEKKDLGEAGAVYGALAEQRSKYLLDQNVIPTALTDTPTGLRPHPKHSLQQRAGNDPYVAQLISQYTDDNQQPSDYRARLASHLLHNAESELLGHRATEPGNPPPGYEGRRSAPSLSRQGGVSRLDLGAAFDADVRVTAGVVSPWTNDPTPRTPGGHRSPSPTHRHLSGDSPRKQLLNADAILENLKGLRSEVSVRGSLHNREPSASQRFDVVKRTGYPVTSVLGKPKPTIERKVVKK